MAPGELVFADPELRKRDTTLLASRNALASDFAQVIAAIKAGQISIDDLHTHSFPAEGILVRLPQLIVEADHVLKAIAPCQSYGAASGRLPLWFNGANTRGSVG